MSHQTGLANALRSRGLAVEEYSGWTTRGSSDFNPRGAVCHWTAGPCGSTGRPSLSTVVNGRPDLSGPLANVYLDRAGIAVVVAAGRANHAGSGGWHGLSGNSSVFGTEAECCNAGDWTAAQRTAYPLVNAAYCDLRGFREDMVCGHNEWAPDRKIDIYDWDMPRMRSEVATILGGGTPVPPPAQDVWCKGDSGQQVSNIQSCCNAIGCGPIAVDGDFGPATESAVKCTQSKIGASVDGCWGPETDSKYWAYMSGGQPPPSGGGMVPPFPFPPGHWMGVKSSNPKNHSGYYAQDRPGIQQYQGQMHERGWNLSVDGMFGPQTQDVTISYQREKGLTADGLAGEQTWHSIYTAPVT